MYFAYKVTTGTNNFVSLIVKILLLRLAFVLRLLRSATAADKTKYFVYLSIKLNSLNSTF